MSQYINSDNNLNERYRLVDILCNDEDGNINNNGTAIYSGVTGTVFYYDRESDEIKSEYLTTGQDISNIYYESTDRAWGWVDTGEKFADIAEVNNNRVTIKKPFKVYFNNGTYDRYVIAEYKATKETYAYRAASSVEDCIRFNEIIHIGGYPNMYVKDVYVNGASFELGLERSDTATDYSRIIEEASIIAEYDSGTSERVKDTILDGKDFQWTDEHITYEMSKTKLFDADGNEVSAIALNKYFDENGNYKGGLFSTSQARVIDEVFASENSKGFHEINMLTGGGATTIKMYITQISKWVNEDLDINLHVGVDSDRTNKIGINIMSLCASAIGIDKLASHNIGIVDGTGDNATDAIDVIANALQVVSRQRSALGAIQNRLDHTIKNLDNVVENTTSAESQIRDTNMAEEMVRYSNNNILQQAGQAMLTQANQSNQGILTLLQ